ncbi:hypothetical protein IEQ34_020205 [Dendrobium chrysotoxum]|uniref:Uncharacterized protein n=1 Tax=Dendrobium chrysotoxum TaxID=161865 RepID=A0AAV7G1F4_DENCH|nr:hypothetical protein IEQ34_020205 [Dendrobium chrysotoxum]
MLCKQLCQFHSESLSLVPSCGSSFSGISVLASSRRKTTTIEFFCIFKKVKLRLSCAFVAFMMPYQRPVTSRCYVTTFRKICDVFVEIIDDEVEQTFRNLKIHQFLKFPAFQQCIPLLFEILKFWNAADEGFVVNGHLLKFTSDEVSLLTANNVNEFNSINWAACIRNFMVNEFNTITDKFAMEKSLGYINDFFPLLLIYLVLQDVTNEEAEGLGADLNAIQNLESRPHLHPSKFVSPKSKKIHTSPPPSPHSPHVEPPQSSPQPPIQPSSLPPTRPSTEQPLPTEWSTVQNKLMEALQNLCNRIEDNLAAPPPPTPPTTEAAPPPPSPPSQVAPPPHSQAAPPPPSQAAPPPPPSQAAPPPSSQAAPPPSSQAAPPPPPSQASPPPPPSEAAPPPPTSQAAPPPPTAEVQDAQTLIKYQPHKKKEMTKKNLTQWRKKRPNKM